MDKTWGKATWYLFHSLAEKIKESEFNNIKNELWSFIVQICNNLPCPICKEHATLTMKTVNKDLILQNKETFIDFFFTFHNTVNVRKKYKLMEKQQMLDLYAKANLPNVVTYFIYHYGKNTNNLKMLSEDFVRKQVITAFKKWYASHSHCFD